MAILGKYDREMIRDTGFLPSFWKSQNFLLIVLKFNESYKNKGQQSSQSRSHFKGSKLIKLLFIKVCCIKSTYHDELNFNKKLLLSHNI